MKTLLLVTTILASVAANATVHELPHCYSTMPTTCGFDEMTLEMCNAEGKKAGSVFVISQRIYVTGGNKFGSAEGRMTCVVRRIKGSEPAKYEVTITK